MWLLIYLAIKLKQFPINPFWISKTKVCYSPLAFITSNLFFSKWVQYLRLVACVYVSITIQVIMMTQLKEENSGKEEKMQTNK